jgi:hypothetical protein
MCELLSDAFTAEIIWRQMVGWWMDDDELEVIWNETILA